MTPEQIKKKVQDAYLKALKHPSMQWQRHSGIHHLFRDLKLYGRDAGIDFIYSHLEAIIQEAVETAGCKNTSLVLTVDGSGQAAMEGITHALRQLTALKIDANRSTVTVSWAEANPGLI